MKSECFFQSWRIYFRFWSAKKFWIDPETYHGPLNVFFQNIKSERKGFWWFSSFLPLKNVCNFLAQLLKLGFIILTQSIHHYHCSLKVAEIWCTIFFYKYSRQILQCKISFFSKKTKNNKVMKVFESHKTLTLEKEWARKRTKFWSIVKKILSRSDHFQIIIIAILKKI